MRPVTVLMSGVSSFTGCHIARALVESGCLVVATLTRGRSTYTEALEQTRLAYSRVEHFVEEAPFGSPAMLQAIVSCAPDVFINHGADIKGYRRHDFDVDRSVQAATHNLSQVLRVLKGAGARRFIHSGTVFEADRGMAAFSPYGEAKTQVAALLQQACVAVNLPFTKIAIPNPVGPYENTDRMIPLFVDMWKRGDMPKVTTPDTIWDFLPAPWLANFYTQETLMCQDQQIRKLYPSGYVESVANFVERFLGYTRQRGHRFSVEIAAKEPQPTGRHGLQKCEELANSAREARFWSQWLDSLGL